MRVSVHNFRSFRSAEDVEIRPLTLLVGQNSTGKTSFLAALRYLLAFRERADPNSLNAPPFDLGSFEAIAHHSEGKRPNRFTIGLKNTVDVNKYPSMYSLRPSNDGESDIKNLSVSLHFIDVFGSAEVGTIEFLDGVHRVVVHLFPTPNLIVYRGKEKVLEAVRALC